MLNLLPLLCLLWLSFTILIDLCLLLHGGGVGGVVVPAEEAVDRESPGGAVVVVSGRGLSR